MKLTFQNKMIMSLRKMVSDGIALNGIPKQIVISTLEASEVICEVNQLHHDKQGGCKKQIEADLRSVEFADSTKDRPNTTVVPLRNNCRSILTAPTKPTSEQLKIFIQQWSEGEIAVCFVPAMLPTIPRIEIVVAKPISKPISSEEAVK